MELLNQLLASALEGEVLEVRLGLHWTAVLARVQGELRCGLSATLRPAEAGVGEHSHGEPDVPEAGRLAAYPARKLAELVLQDRPVLNSVGMAALNALLPLPTPDQIAATVETNASEVLARLGKGRRVALIGHFPFVAQLRSEVGELIVLELHPRPGDLPAEAAARVLPSAEVVAITSMTLVNHTLPGLLPLISPQAFVMLLGPSTPLSPILFDYGVHFLSGSLVTNPQAVLRLVSEGGNFRQVHRVGVRLVNLVHPDFKEL